MSKRIKYCDALKFIAVICVIMIHTYADYRDFYIIHNIKYYELLTMLDCIVRVGVPIFFMLTGAFMLNKKLERSYFDYLKKRMPKLIIPFFIISIIYYISLKYIHHFDISLMDFLIKVTSAGGVKYHLWFMYVIILIYIFIPYLNTFIKSISKKRLKQIIIIIIIFGNLFFTINRMTLRYNMELLGGFTLPTIIIYLNYLFMGYYLYNYDLKKNEKIFIYVLSIISFIMMPIADYFYIQETRNDFMLNCHAIFSVFPAISIFSLMKEHYDNFKVNKHLDKLITKVSSLSLYIYLIHVLVLELIKVNLFKIIQPSGFKQDILMIIFLNITVFIISIIMAIIIDKIYNYIDKLVKKK